LQSIGNNTLNGAITVGANGAAISAVNAGETLTITDGCLVGNGCLTKIGNGTLDLGNDLNSYTASMTYVQRRGAAHRRPRRLGNVAMNLGNVTANSAGILQVDGTGPAGYLTLNNFLTFNCASGNGGLWSLGNNVLQGNIALVGGNNTFNVSNANDVLTIQAPPTSPASPAPAA